MSDTPKNPQQPDDLSQADIDAALAAGGITPEGDSGAPPAPDAAAPDSTAPVADATAPGAEAAAVPDATPSPDDAAAVESSAEAIAASVTAEPESFDPLAGFSQADIDAALAAATGDAPPAPAPKPTPVAAAGPPKLDTMGRPFDEAAAAMEAAMAEERAEVAAAAAARAAAPPPAPAPLPPPPAGAITMDLPDFGRRAVNGEDIKGVELLGDVDLHVKVELGRAEMAIEEVLRLGEGAVVELDKLAGDPVDVLVNDRLVARGEVLILNDNFCVRISEIVAGEDAEAAA